MSLRADELHLPLITEVESVAGSANWSRRRQRDSVSLRIGDIANVDGSPGLCARVRELDLESVERWGQSFEVTRQQIEMRLLVEGLNRSQFAVIGPRECLVRIEAPQDIVALVERCIAREIARQFARPESSVSVSVVNKSQIERLPADCFDSRTPPQVFLPTQLPVGRTRVQLEYEDERGQRNLQYVDIVVVVTMKVAIAKERIQRGKLIDQRMVELIERPISKRDDFAEPQMLIGRSATRDIPAHQVVLSNYVAGPTARKTAKPEEEPVLIHAGEYVDVVAHFGVSKVYLKNAKSLSAGRRGEVITLLNPRSNKRLTATVVSGKLAQVIIAQGKAP